MRIWNIRNKPMTHYQRVKNRAAQATTALGAACLAGALVAFFFIGLDLVLFLAAASLGFLLVGFQQRVDAIAADDERPQRKE